MVGDLVAAVITPNNYNKRNEIHDLFTDNMHLIRPRECVHDALYLVGELKPHYPVPATLVRTYTDPFPECLDMRSDYWEPSRRDYKTE